MNRETEAMRIILKNAKKFLKSILARITAPIITFSFNYNYMFGLYYHQANTTVFRPMPGKYFMEKTSHWFNNALYYFSNSSSIQNGEFVECEPLYSHLWKISFPDLNSSKNIHAAKMPLMMHPKIKCFYSIIICKELWLIGGYENQDEFDNEEHIHCKEGVVNIFNFHRNQWREFEYIPADFACCVASYSSNVVYCLSNIIEESINFAQTNILEAVGSWRMSSLQTRSEVYDIDELIVFENSIIPVSYTHLTLPTKRIV